MPPPLIESSAFVLMQAGQVAHEWVAQAVEVFDLSVQEFATLMVVNRLGPVAQGWIAMRLGMSEPALVKVVARLERDGLVGRFPHPWDARVRRVGITRAGIELLAEAADEVATLDAEPLRIVSPSLRQRLAHLPPDELPVALSALQRNWR